MSTLKKQGKPSIYETSFKVAIVRQYLTGNLGYGKLAKKFGLAGDTVRYFVKWYRARYPDGIEQIEDISTPPVSNSSNDKALKQANLKIAGLEMLIEIAGKELGIDLVKKLGTKQSKK